MTRKEILEQYGIRMVWKPDRDYVELSEEEEKETHEFAMCIIDKVERRNI